MRHLLKEVALGNGIQISTLCGAVPSSAYDYVQVYFTEAHSLCTECVRRWYDAKKEENLAFEREAGHERDRNAVEAGQRLDGSFK